MSFEDLLQKKPACKTCSFIESLDPTTQREIDIAMAKPKYSHETLAKGLKQIDPDLVSSPVPSSSSIENHREREHRSA